MARSWEYARWRRIARQTVLCASLGLTIALAWWIGHLRAVGLRVELGEPQTFENKVLPLEVRLPPSPAWTLEADLDEDTARLDASEQKSRYGTHRVVGLFLHRLHPAGGTLLTPEQIAAHDVGKRASQHVQELNFLGHPGVMIEYPVEMGDKPGGHPLWAVLYACTVVPTPKPTAVCVGMESPIDFTPADMDLLKQFAHSLSLVDPAHKAPSIPTADLKPRALGMDRPGADDTTDNDDGN